MNKGNKSQVENLQLTILAKSSKSLRSSYASNRRCFRSSTIFMRSSSISTCSWLTLIEFQIYIEWIKIWRAEQQQQKLSVRGDHKLTVKLIKVAMKSRTKITPPNARISRSFLCFVSMLSALPSEVDDTDKNGFNVSAVIICCTNHLIQFFSFIYFFNDDNNVRFRRKKKYFSHEFDVKPFRNIIFYFLLIGAVFITFNT